MRARPDARAAAAIPGIDPPEGPIRALVAFVGATRLRWLRWLRPGFRHCFLVIEADGGCVVCDPLANRMVISHVGGATLDRMRRHCWQRGYTVLEAGIGEVWSGEAALLRPFTCVEFVKRTLGVRAPAVLTPWQLYRLLRASPPGAQSALDGGILKG